MGELLALAAEDALTLAAPDNVPSADADDEDDAVEVSLHDDEPDRVHALLLDAVAAELLNPDAAIDDVRDATPDADAEAEAEAERVGGANVSTIVLSWMGTMYVTNDEFRRVNRSYPPLAKKAYPRARSTTPPVR